MNPLKGRINRTEYIIGLIVVFTTVYSTFSTLTVFKPSILTTYPIVTYVAIIIPSLFFVSLGIRRLHDLGYNALEKRVFENPSLLYQSGNKSVNKFGKPPQGISIKRIFGLS